MPRGDVVTMKSRVLVVLAFLMVAGAAQARELILPRATYFSPRLLGMGGAFVGVSDDRNLFFTNPAGLSYVPHGRFGAEIGTLSINHNTVRAISFFQDNKDTFDNLDNLSNTDQAAFYDKVLAEIGGERSDVNAHVPVYVLLPAGRGSSRPHLGFGVFGSGGGNFLTLGGASGVPIADLNVDVHITGVVSAAWDWVTPLAGQLTVGTTAKIDHRRLSLNRKSMFELSDSPGVDFLNDTNLGFDLAFMYEVDPTLRFGATVFDVWSSQYEFGSPDITTVTTDVLQTGDTAKVEPALAIGVAWEADVWFGPIHDVLFALDVRQPFDEEQDFWGSIYMGAETSLSFLKVRAGFSEGYPVGGLGIGPIHYAYFATEAGNYPGAKSNYLHALSFALGFGL
jgi:hypothetical protein